MSGRMPSRSLFNKSAARVRTSGSLLLAACARAAAAASPVRELLGRRLASFEVRCCAELLDRLRDLVRRRAGTGFGLPHRAANQRQNNRSNRVHQVLAANDQVLAANNVQSLNITHPLQAKNGRFRRTAALDPAARPIQNRAMTASRHAALKSVPDAAGRFGQFGGRYVPETLIRAR